MNRKFSNPDGLNAALVALGLYPDSGGPTKSVPSFAEALSARVVSWVDPRRHTGDSQIWQDCYTVTASRLPGLRGLLIPSIKNQKEAGRQLRGASLISCHSFWRWHCAWTRRYAKACGIPYWWVPHGSLDPYVLRHGTMVKQVYLATVGRLFLRDAAAVVCSTRREYLKIRKFVGTAKPHLVLPWPLEDQDFRERSTEARMGTRRELGIGKDELLLLYFGRMHPMKRPLEVIKIFAESQLPAAKLLFVGNDDGVSIQEGRESAAVAGVADKVIFAGPVYGQEKYRFIDAADAYISLSWRENFNYTAVECLASGLPVILSPGNDIGVELEPVKCGIILRDDSIACAVRAIREMAALSPDQRVRSGRAGHDWAKQNLSKGQFKEKLLAFARDTVARHRVDTPSHRNQTSETS